MRYCVEEEKIENEEIGTYTAYGIMVYRGEKLIRVISDVFTSRERAESFCNSCNGLQLDPIHIDEVIDDCL